MLGRHFIGASILIGALAFVPQYVSAQTADWVYFTQRSNHDKLEDFVNTQCKPKDNSGIVGMIWVSTGAQQRIYDLHVWCRKDDASNVLWRKKIDPFSKGSEDGVAARLQLGKISIIGIVPTWVGTGETLLLLEKH
jgi:hypothetical protein